MKGIKMILAVVLLGLLAVACNGNKPDNKVLRSDTVLKVNVKKDMRVLKAEGDYITGLMTPRQVVQYASVFHFAELRNGEWVEVEISIIDDQKDFVNNRINMGADRIMNDDGTLNTYWIEMRDVRIYAGNNVVPDYTIAYIPNSVMEQAEKEIKKAYSESRMDDVYRLFQELYIANPITNDMWLELKGKGEN